MMVLSAGSPDAADPPVALASRLIMFVRSPLTIASPALVPPSAVTAVSDPLTTEWPLLLPLSRCFFFVGASLLLRYDETARRKDNCNSI